jgi:hypothetical protein
MSESCFSSWPESFFLVAATAAVVVVMVGLPLPLPEAPVLATIALVVVGGLEADELLTAEVRAKLLPFKNQMRSAASAIANRKEIRAAIWARRLFFSTSRKVLAFGRDHSALLYRRSLYTAGDNLFAQLLRPPGEGLQRTGKTVEAVACSRYATYLITTSGVYRSGPYRKIVTGTVRSFVADDEFHAYVTSDGAYRDSEGKYLPGPYQQLHLRGNLLSALDAEGYVWLLSHELIKIPLPAVRSFDVTETDVWLVTLSGQCYCYRASGLLHYPIPQAVTAVVCGNMHTLVLLATGEVWSRGSDQWGQLGTGMQVDGSREAFAPVLGIPVAAEIFAGEEMSALRTPSGHEWWCWGRNDSQQLGLHSSSIGVVQPTRLVF